MAESAKKESKGFSVEALIKNPLNLLFLVLAIFTFSLLVPMSYAGYHYSLQLSKDSPEGYNLPHLSDFKITVISAGVFAAIKHLFESNTSWFEVH